MGKNVTMNAMDTINGANGSCYVTIEGSRYLLMQVVNVKASGKINSEKIPIMGQTNKGNKPGAIEYSGSATLHYATDVLREMLYKYQETGKRMYFDMQIENNDPNSEAGRKSTILKDCCLTDGAVAMLDADKSTLDEDISFTFERFEMPEKFKNLSGM